MSLLFLFLFTFHAPADSILGTWHGTSLCVDKSVDTRCSDEVVVYEIDTAGVKISGNVMVHGYKIVNNERDWMGDLELRYDVGSGLWLCDFTSRDGGGIQFRFRFSGSEMKGTLVELPSERQIRKIEVRRK